MKNIERRRRGMFTTGEKWVEWGLGKRGLGMLEVFWAGILVEITQEIGVVPCCRRTAIGTPF